MFTFFALMVKIINWLCKQEAIVVATTSPLALKSSANQLFVETRVSVNMSRPLYLTKPSLNLRQIC